jgi:MFS family permease
VSFFTGGAFCGAGLAGPVGDRLGRKWTIFIGSMVYLLGGALQTGAQNLNMLWAGRWIAGLGVGFLVMISKFFPNLLLSESGTIERWFGQVGLALMVYSSYLPI